MVAKIEGVSQITVSRTPRTFGVQPHSAKALKQPNDPFIIENVRDIAGLYLNLPDPAVGPYVDEIW